MNYVFLLLSSFFAAFALGYVKFFAIPYLSEEVYSPNDKEWIIQIVGSLMTIGPVLVYFISAVLASSFRKKYIMFFTPLIAAVILLFGFLTDWFGSVWFYLFMTGLFMGVYSTAKMASVPLEAMRSKKKTDTINAGMSILFIIGMLLGFYCGAKAYEWNIFWGTMLGLCVFVLSAIFALFCHFPDEKLDSFANSATNLISDTLSLSFKYGLYLISGPLFWGIAGAVSLATTAYAEKNGLGTFAECSVMSAFSAVGIIVGSSISPFFSSKRFHAAFIASFCMMITIILIPLTMEMGLHYFSLSTDNLYYIISGILVFTGCSFGICVNLIDSELLHRAGEENKEGTGAALQSACVSCFSFIVGGLIGLTILFGLVNSITQFILLASIVVVGLLFIFILGSIEGVLNDFYANSLCFFGKLILGLRYKINIKGLEHLQSDKGILVLPNHPAEIDPVILCVSFWKKAKLCPVTTETFYYKKGLNIIMKLINAFPMPDMEKGAGYFKKLRIDKELKHIANELNNGNNVLIYPAGRLIRNGREKLGAASGVSEIMKNTNDIDIVFVKTRGLWGSLFSTATTNGETPDLGVIIIKTFKILLSNFIFFTPKRNVEIEIIPAPANFAEIDDILEKNQIMEDFFNSDIAEQEELSFVSFKRGKKVFPEIESANSAESTVSLDNIDKTFIDEVIKKFSDLIKVDIKDITIDKRLSDDLGLDSLSKAEVLQWLDDEYFVTDVELTELKTVGDVIFIASGENQDLKSSGDIVTPEQWIENETKRPKIIPPQGETIAEAFLNVCDLMGNNVAMADDVSGVITWKRFKIGSLLLANIFKEYPEENIGVMLPASVGAAMTSMAVLLAGKTPVMINWTTGSKNLNHVSEITGISKVITSGNFLDKLIQADFGTLEDKFVFLEDLKRDKMGLGEKISAMLQARKKSSQLLKSLNIHNKTLQDNAVILFTSGSESVPKGVPLTNENILVNLAGTYDVLDFNNSTIYGFLPPFHSFGFTITTMLPLCTGIKVAYYPNPTEGRKIAAGCAKWKVTVMCGTPSFISGILKAGKESLKTVKTFVAGAEKTPDSLFAEIKTMGDDVHLYEGYGITECSPVLTINYPNDEPEGVGKPLNGVEILIVNPETNEPITKGERGLILARGKSIFRGYLKIDNNPFIKIQDKEWYNTGDLGYLTESNALILAGRMKRFIKIGGEMISLPAIETALIEKYPANEDGPIIAIHANEKPGERPILCLFASLNIDIKTVNEYLKSQGFSNLSKIGKVIKLDNIPLLGTGKTDYQTLKKLI